MQSPTFSRLLAYISVLMLATSASAKPFPKDHSLSHESRHHAEEGEGKHYKAGKYRPDEPRKSSAEKAIGSAQLLTAPLFGVFGKPGDVFDIGEDDPQSKESANTLSMNPSDILSKTVSTIEKGLSDTASFKENASSAVEPLEGVTSGDEAVIAAGAQSAVTASGVPAADRAGPWTAVGSSTALGEAIPSPALDSTCRSVGASGSSVPLPVSQLGAISESVNGNGLPRPNGSQPSLGLASARLPAASTAQGLGSPAGVSGATGSVGAGSNNIQQGGSLNGVATGLSTSMTGNLVGSAVNASGGSCSLCANAGANPSVFGVQPSSIVSAPGVATVDESQATQAINPNGIGLPTNANSVTTNRLVNLPSSQRSTVSAPPVAPGGDPMSLNRPDASVFGAAKSVTVNKSGASINTPVVVGGLQQQQKATLPASIGAPSNNGTPSVSNVAGGLQQQGSTLPMSAGVPGNITPSVPVVGQTQPGTTPAAVFPVAGASQQVGTIPVAASSGVANGATPSIPVAGAQDSSLFNGASPPANTIGGTQASTQAKGGVSNMMRISLDNGPYVLV